MNRLDPRPISHSENIEPDRKEDSTRGMHSQAHGIHDTSRLVELEIENSRLHRLVAELLIKNQQLRKPD
jgi:hypothetical protein